jgi:hypothetical protein
VAEWKAERVGWPRRDTPASFLNRRGGRLSAHSIDLLLEEVASAADLVDETGRPTIPSAAILIPPMSELGDVGIHLGLAPRPASAWSCTSQGMGGVRAAASCAPNERPSEGEGDTNV